MKVFCVIPAWNEEKNINKVVKEVQEKVDEVVVIDDGSEDKTLREARAGGATVLRHLVNRGQGAALQTGNQYALSRGAEIIIHFDADGQFLAREISDLIKPIREKRAKIVFGSRFLEKKSRIPFAKKIFLLPLAHLVNKLLLGVNLTDPQSGFRAMSQEAVKKVEIEQDGMAHCSEIIYKTFKYNLKFQEVPITVIYHGFGQKFSGGIRIIKDLLLAKIMN